MSYAPANLGRAADQLSDEGIMDLFQRELEDIFPELRGHVVERQLHRTDPGIPYPFVGRGRIQPVLTRRRERIHLAGDYLGSWYAETSAWTARRAAEAALAEFG
jgi:oxygen-dependent protoporphyrinogen oxidase